MLVWGIERVLRQLKLPGEGGLHQQVKIMHKKSVGMSKISI